MYLLDGGLDAAKFAALAERYPSVRAHLTERFSLCGASWLDAEPPSLDTMDRLPPMAFYEGADLALARGRIDRPARPTHGRRRAGVTVYAP